MEAALVESRQPVSGCGFGVWSSDAMRLCTPHDAMQELQLTARHYLDTMSDGSGCQRGTAHTLEPSRFTFA